MKNRDKKGGKELLVQCNKCVMADFYVNATRNYSNTTELTNNESVIVHQAPFPMNNSKLCNILEIGSRVALRERLEVFWECSQVGRQPGVMRPFGELLPLENHSPT